MTDKKISELGTITQGDIASGDWVAVVDSSENATKKFDFSVVIAATNSFDDVTAFFASTDTYAAGTIVGTRAEGFSYRAVDTATATTVANAGGQEFEVLEGSDGRVNGKSVGATGNGATDDSTALNKMLDFPAVLLPRGTYLTESPLVAVDDLISLQGIGWHTTGGNNGPESGSRITAPNTVADLLTVQSSNPENQATSRAQGSIIEKLRLDHRGSGAALTINNVIETSISDVYIECHNEGAIGLDTKNWAFLLRAERLKIQRFSDVGCIVRGPGTQHVFRDCFIAANNSTATSALKITKQDFLVDGGQYNVKRPDNTGVGILIYNEGATTLSGGRIERAIGEADTAIKIDGATASFAEVDVVNQFASLDLSFTRKLIVFGRALRCRLMHPGLQSAGSGGILAEWSALSVDCGVICTLNSARAPFIVDASATRPYLQVTGRVEYDQLASIGLDASGNVIDALTVHVDDCQFFGRNKRWQGVWLKQRHSLSDDEILEIPLPANGFGGVANSGTLEFLPGPENVNGYAKIAWQNSGAAAFAIELVSGANATVSGTFGDFSTDGGTDGHFNVSWSGTSIWVRNRRGGVQAYRVVFHADE